MAARGIGRTTDEYRLDKAEGEGGNEGNRSIADKCMYGKGLFADIERGLFVELGSGFACLYLVLDTSEKSRCWYKTRLNQADFSFFAF